MRLLFDWSRDKWILIAANILFGSVLIVLFFTKILPLDPINFVFFSFVGFLLSLYRPGWMFLLLVGILPYEIIGIAPENFGITIRVYQWLLVLIVLSLIVRYALGRFSFQKFVFNFWDALLIIFGISSFFSALFSVNQPASLKLSFILFSFILLYFLFRSFVHSLDDTRMILPFLLSSFLVVSCYAILQNILFLGGLESLEIMAGRPNATFAEADWLGGYLAVMVTITSALIISQLPAVKNFQFKLERYIFPVLLFFGFTALIISMSRSAWLAAVAGIIFVILNGQNNCLRETGKKCLHILVPFLLALFAVYVFHLTAFNIFDRGQSVTSGKQKITVACMKTVVLPKTIDDVKELADYNCEHIRLEDIAKRKTAGEYVTEISRRDPNVHIRKNIYEKSISILKEHWFLGVGFGAIADYLGTDERGTGLNASNIFLEIWLGSGVIGFLAFMVFWIGLGWKWLYSGIQKQNILSVLLSSIWIAATVFNLFNSGLFLGWFFAILAFLLIDSAHSVLFDKNFFLPLKKFTFYDKN